MVWSFSSSKVFKKCQRQWYFREKVAHHGTKDPQRWEAYLLTKLQSIDAWRGNLVDSVISKQVVSALNNKTPIDLDRTLSYAQRLFQKQLEFAMAHRLRVPDVRPAQVGDVFAAFHAVEYGLEITDVDIDRAWEDVEKSLTNFFGIQELLTDLKRGNYRVAQRPLSFRHYQNISVKAVPDLIVFFENEPPMIIDWKVNTFGTRDYRLQLAIYAVALARCKPHSDFPYSLERFNPTDFCLIEVQLLTNQQRKYILSDTDIADVDTYIAGTAAQMLLAQESENGYLGPFDFPATNHPDMCQCCAFRSLCW